jgi:uncharacterized membrane protein YdjX (TVP38/TMEM64 family)
MRASKWIWRVLPLTILVGLSVTAFALGLDKYLTLDALRENRHGLQAYFTEHKLIASAAFVATYTAVVAMSLPGATIMSLASGFLFGMFAGTAFVLVGATLGAVLVFIAARSAFGDFLHARAGPFLRKMEDGFRDNAFYYLLFLRLVPAFPFWAVNLAAALLGVPLITFFVATMIGIIPGTMVFVAFGSGLGNIFESGTEVRLSDVFNATLVTALVGLGLLALLPIAIRKWKEQRR